MILSNKHHTFIYKIILNTKKRNFIALYQKDNSTHYQLKTRNIFLSAKSEISRICTVKFQNV